MTTAPIRWVVRVHDRLGTLYLSHIRKCGIRLLVTNPRRAAWFHERADAIVQMALLEATYAECRFDVAARVPARR